MSSITSEQRADLLAGLRFDAGQAESAQAHRIAADFYPVPEHLRALEPDVVLIVGDRGAGKSMLVSAAASPELRAAIVSRSPGLRVPTGEADWLRAFPVSDGPDAAGWQNFAQTHSAQVGALQDLWFAYLARLLSAHVDAKAKEELVELFECQGGDAEACFAAFKKAGVSVLLALDRLDRELEQKRQWLLIAYDELDTIVLSDWHIMGVIIRGLVSFWASYARRWKRIRGKIFLRTDFYRRHADIAGADIAKLAGNRVELTWSDKHLYALLIKKISNQSTSLHRYAKLAPVVFEPSDPILKYIPKVSNKEDARPFVERLVGPYMGANDKKGQSFNWILDAVRDGNKRVSPRSLVQLIELAAEREQSTPRATGTQLLHPVSLRNALDGVSKRHVVGASDEFRWLLGVKERLQRDREVPWERKEIEKLLRAKWDESWSNTDFVAAPADSPRELVDYLLELGIVRDRGRNHFDVPDLFLAGLELVRRGGVARK